MTILLLLLSIFTSVIGSICGIGGGVLTKPFLDAMNIMSVSAASFLSGCTVLAMAAISVYKSTRGRAGEMDGRITPYLGAGAVVGGVAGKMVFTYIRQAAGSEALVGLSQSVVLALITVGTLIYMVLKEKGRVKTLCVTSVSACLGIGFALGVLSSFLGIGGGPINLAVLSYFFSMNVKKSAINSLGIVFLSQIASLAQTFVTKSVPDFNTSYFLAMVAGGVIGGFLGQRVNKCLCEKKVAKLYDWLLVVIIAICVYNALRFAGAL